MADWPYNTAQWQRLRKAKLYANPLCQPCEAAHRIEVANTVDHDVPISAGGPAFPPIDQLTSMCPSCHSRKTARGVEAGAVRTTRTLQPRKGCDATGRPLDAAHPWNEKSLTAAQPKTAMGTNTQLVSSRRRSDGADG